MDVGNSFRLGVAALAFGGLLALPSAAFAAGSTGARTGGTAPTGQHRQFSGSAGMHLSATGMQLHQGRGTRRGAAHLQQHPRLGGGFGNGLGADLQAVATALKLTPQQLQQQLQSGKSIAQVAQAQSVPLQTLKDAITAAAKSRLDQEVAAGRLTSAQENRRLSTLQSNLDQRLNATGDQYPRRAGRSGRSTSSAPPAPSASGS